MKTVCSLALLVLALGCRETRLTIEVTLPNGAGELGPAPGVTVAALPYDRDSILTSLENASPTPRPHTSELDSLFQRFREPFGAATRLATLAGRLRAALAAAEADPARAALRPALRDSLALIDRSHAAAAARLDSVRRVVGPRIDSLQVEVRAWEAETFRRYAEITSGLGSGRLVPGISDTTRADGTARLYLPPSGRAWWIYARSFNSGDPNSEWYWNVPVTGSRIVLDTSTARLRPRY